MIDATVAKREAVSDEELLIICLKNAPEGTDRKQVLRLIKYYEIILARPTGPYNLFPQPNSHPIEEELEEPPKYLEGLAKLSQRESPWKDNECKHST